MPKTTIDLGSDNATFTGGDGDYLIVGANGNNTVTLGDGADQLILGDGNNTFTLGNGPDQVSAGLGNNTVTVGSGDDTVTLTDGNNTVTAGDGSDVIMAGNGANIVAAGNGNDQVTVGDGFNQVTTGNGDSTVVVGNGAGDTVSVGLGSNAILLGTGVGDVVHTAAGGNTVFVSAAAVGADTILGALTSADGTTNKLDLTTAGTSSLAGVSGFGAFLLGNGGADAISLTDANFTRVPGPITVVGGDSGNTVNASGLSAANSVAIYAGDGNNTLTGGAGNDFFHGHVGTSMVDGGGGFNTMGFSGPMADYVVSTDGDVTTVTGDGEFDTLLNVGNLVFDSPACFAVGTLIQCATGEVAVECLQPGDLVILAKGGATPVRWIGYRSYGGRFLAGRPHHLMPILIRAGSLGDGLPRNDLRVSPSHSMFLDGMLVPAKLLVNGATIVQERGLKQVDYYHVELDSHDVVLAEGAPSESFVDDDSRGMFHNAAEWERLYPRRVRAPAVFCAPRVESGPELDAIRRRLDMVAGPVTRAV